MAAVIGGRSLPAETLGAKLRRLARQNRFDNPFVNGVMSAPPTLTANASATAGSNFYWFGFPNAAALRTFGGTRVYTPNANYARFPVSTLAPVGSDFGNVSGNGQPGNQGATSFQMEFMADAATVSVYLANSTTPFRFLVQGPETGGRLQYVNLTGTVVNTGGGAGYANLAFGSRALRRIVVEGELAHGFVGVQVGATESVYPTDGADILRGFCLGDSFVEGTGATRTNDNVANVMMSALGLRDRRCSGLGGTGWRERGAAAGGMRYTIGERIAIDLVPQNPDVAFIQAGINDGAYSQASVTPEVATRLRQLRAALPAVPVFVFGPWPGLSGPSPTLIGIENAIAAGVAAAGDPLAIFVPVLTDPSGPWMSGTGKTDAPTGSGNADLYVSPDGTHPPSAGHGYLGLRAADAVMTRLESVP